MSRLAVLTRQYVTRFGASLYAADFLRDLAGAVARLGLADDPADYKLLSSALAALPPDDRRAFLLNFAKSGLVSGRFAAAASAATEALESSKADSPEAMRARLYLAASRLFSDAYDAALADLRALTAAKLDRADLSLLAAARRVAAELRVIPDQSVFNTENAAALPDADKSKPSGPELTIAQAQDALQRTSSLAPPTQIGVYAMTAPAAAPASGPIAPAVARPSSATSSRPVRLRGRAQLASRRGGESGRPSSGRGTAGSLERNGAGRALGWTDGSSFAAQRQRALVGFAIRLAGRLDDERTPASRGQFAFARLACDESPEIREQRRLPCRRRQSGDRRATGRRTRVPLRRRHFRRNDCEPDARDQHAIRAGRRFRRRPCGPIRSQRRTRPDRRLFAGRASGESLGRRRSADRNRRVPDGGRRSLGRASNTSRGRHAGGRARSRAQRTKGRGLRASACRPGRDLRGSPRASGIKRQGGRRSASRSGYLRRAASSANRPVRRAAVGAFRRRGGVPIRWLDLQRPTRRRRAPRERARPWLRALDSADPRDRCRSFARRPRGCLDDDATRRRQALRRHPRRELSHPRHNRRRARRDRRSHGGDRPAAQLARLQADRRQHRWECEWKRVFR